MKTRRSFGSSGFTLVELMVAIVIVAVLAGLVFALSKRGIRSANSVKDMATMRQVYQTIPLYAADNNGFLPGPLYTGVKAVYRPSATGRLANFIHPYLGYDDPQVDEFLPAMAYSWQKSEQSQNTNCAYMREDIPVHGSNGEETIKPYGHPLRSADQRNPMKLNAVFARIDPARTWAISDLDQLHPDIGNPAWKSEIPEEMSHGTYRLAVFFDGSAGKLDEQNNPR